MSTNLNSNQLAKFLVEAKIVTYASGNDDFTVEPALLNSHQLEFTQGNLLYRDIYYGGLHFIGLETVFQDQQPVWGMNYYGGVLPGSNDSQISGMPAVLKAALREVPIEAPYRGPAYFHLEEYTYENEIQGEFSAFHGQETIRFNNQPIYQLFYSGGQIK